MPCSFIGKFKVAKDSPCFLWNWNRTMRGRTFSSPIYGNKARRASWKRMLPEGRWLLRAFFAAEADAESLLSHFASHRPRLTHHPARNWVAESRAAWEPIAAGRRFYLVPEWRDDPAPGGRLRIAINPGLACGTGYHVSHAIMFGSHRAIHHPGDSRARRRRWSWDSVHRIRAAGIGSSDRLRRRPGSGRY